MSGKHYTEQEDAYLVVFGLVLGFNRVGVEDLGRPARSGAQRMAWLRKNRPEFVAKCERGAEAGPE